MKVVLGDELFEASFRQKDPFFLPALLRDIERRDHIASFPTEAGQHVHTWLDGLPFDQREEVDLIIGLSLEREARQATDCVVIATTGATDWGSAPPKVGPADLLHLVREPLEILVEDDRSDGAFLQCMGFGIDGDTFVHACKANEHRQPLVEFRHGGGSSMNEKLRSLPLGKAFRTWTVFDSDKLAPKAALSKAVEAKVKASKEKLIDRYHRLERRESENYCRPKRCSIAPLTPTR